MRTSMAFLAGAGTVVVAIAAGVGCGLLIADMVSPHSSNKEMTRLEQRMSSKPIPVSNAPAVPVPYLTATSPAAAAEPAQNQPQDEAASATAPKAPPTQAAPEQAKATEQTKAPEDAFSKARDVDVRRESRRAEREKRRAERRQQWVERHRYMQRHDDEPRDVELKVREETERPQAFASEPARIERIEMPRIKLFGDD